MAISSVAVSHHQSYLFSRSSERTLVSTGEYAPEPVNERVPRAQVVQEQAKTVNHQKLTGQTQSQVSQKEDQDAIYERPVQGSAALIKLILQHMLKEDIRFIEENVTAQQGDEGNRAMSETGTMETAQLNSIELDGMQFQANEIIEVSRTETINQQLSFSMNQQLLVDGQTLDVSFSLGMSQSFSRKEQFTQSAAELKDPLVIQFGENSIGAISHTAQFSLYDQQVNLPMFSGDVGYLVHDKNGNGVADNGSELFGPKSNQGFVELASLDDNKNGFIDEGDSQFDELYIWRTDKSGQSYWQNLQGTGIMAISLSASSSPYTFFDSSGETQAQMRDSSLVIDNQGRGKGIHQIDLLI